MRPVAFLIVCGGLALAAAARADATPAEKGTARELFKQGKEARDAGDPRTVLERFSAAHALLPSPVTGLELARMHAQVGHLVQARELAVAASRAPESKTETEKSARARVSAGDLANALHGRIATLTVKVAVTPPSPTSLEIDGKTVPAMNAPQRLDPGDHVLSARSSDGRHAQVDVSLFLVGRDETWVVAQTVTNESAPSELTTVFTTSTAAGLSSIRRATLSRGYGSAIQPFVFAASTTPHGPGGYAGADGDLIDIADGGEKAGIVPTHATVTTNDPGAATVFARGTATPDDRILAFRNATPVVVETFPLPGINKEASILAATNLHLVFFGPSGGASGKPVTMHACLTADVIARRCMPAVVDLPIESVLRLRSSGSSLYVLGKASGTPRLLRVAFR